jgi:hypothetical protein
LDVTGYIENGACTTNAEDQEIVKEQLEIIHAEEVRKKAAAEAEELFEAQQAADGKPKLKRTAQTRTALARSYGSMCCLLAHLIWSCRAHAILRPMFGWACSGPFEGSSGSAGPAPGETSSPLPPHPHAPSCVGWEILEIAMEHPRAEGIHQTYPSLSVAGWWHLRPTHCMYFLCLPATRQQWCEAFFVTA